MQLPDFIMALPSIDVPFPEEVVETHAMRTEDALLVYFIFHQDVSLPPHSHGAQWGTLLQGEVRIIMDGVARTYIPGDCWNIQPGVEHEVSVKAGTIAIDSFAEPDRYPLKPRE